jgi:hypothetical protein
MKTQKTELPENQMVSDLPIWVGVKKMNILFGCKKTTSYDKMNLIKELIKDEHPEIYKVKGKILTKHLISHNDFPISKEDVLKSLKEGISLVDISANNIHSALSD